MSLNPEPPPQLSRRRLLGVGGAGLLASSLAACRPPFLREPDHRSGVTPAATLAEVAGRERQKSELLGYPINMRTPAAEFFAWRRRLLRAGIDGFAFNNVGDPFKESPLPYNTHGFERAIVQAFGRLFAFPPEDTWGFLSHSGTDSNMHGMYLGRTLLRGRTGVLPKVYYSAEAHYSVPILQDLLGLEAVIVATEADGGMDPAALAAALAAHRDAPALVVPTVGTTFKGAIDGVDRLQAALGDHPRYVHVDAALFGGYLPFTGDPGDAAEVACQPAAGGPRRYDSIAVSCHKFFGFPTPAGLFLVGARAHREFTEYFSGVHNPEYIHQVPGTITCSRDPVKPGEFYYFTTPGAQATLAADAQAILEDAGYLHDQLRRHFPGLGATRLGRKSNTIYFRRPTASIVRRYSLATMDLEVEGRREGFAHVVVMPHATRTILDRLLEDLAAAGHR